MSTTTDAPRYRIRKQTPEQMNDADRFPWYYTGADDNEARDYGTVETFAQALAAVIEDDRQWQACAEGRHRPIRTRTGAVVCGHCHEEWSVDDGPTPTPWAAAFQPEAAAA